jgi:hypothetical protein
MDSELIIPKLKTYQLFQGKKWREFLNAKPDSKKKLSEIQSSRSLKPISHQADEARRRFPTFAE